MAQAKARPNEDGQTQLSSVIHLIAADPDSEDSIRIILQMVQDEAGASGASFILFDEPEMSVTTGQVDTSAWPIDQLQNIVAQLSDELHADVPLADNLRPQSAYWAVYPIHQQKPGIGAIWLFSSTRFESGDVKFRQLDSLVACLKIIATSIRTRELFKKLNRNQNEFMRIVSHDLRSPLTSMQGFASMLELELVGELNEKQKHFVTKILSGITQMTALVDNIQDAGRYDPETGFYDLNRSHCDLGEIVRRIVENHLVPAEKALNISVSVADDVPIINADANMLERAIINLYDNAIKYTPDGGKIEVGVKRLKEDVTVVVRDTGLGISSDAQQHLFERHVRIAREEHKKIKGSGLGLFIVRSVAQRHGGDAWVESNEGEGSAFFLSIPLDGPNLVSARD